MRGDENLAGTKGKSKKETSEFQRFFFYVGNIACDVSGITTKAPCKAASGDVHHLRIEISAFVIHVRSAAPSPSPSPEASLKAGSSGHGICGRAH